MENKHKTPIIPRYTDEFWNTTTSRKAKTTLKMFYNLSTSRVAVTEAKMLRRYHVAIRTLAQCGARTHIHLLRARCYSTPTAHENCLVWYTGKLQNALACNDVYLIDRVNAVYAGLRVDLWQELSRSNSSPRLCVNSIYSVNQVDRLEMY